MKSPYDPIQPSPSQGIDMTQFQTKSHTHPPAATIVRPFLYIQQLLGLHIEVDIGSTNFLVSIILLFLLLIIYLWNRRRRRIDSYRSSHAVGTPGFQRLIARQESLLLSLKESGNRAYLEREYEKAAEHFQTARDEAIHLIKRGSRKYAKRQLSWFRRLKEIHWFDVTNSQSFREIEELVAGKFPLARE